MTEHLRAGFGERKGAEGQTEAETNAFKSWTPGKGEGAEDENGDSRN
jgi:hypothetical protein